MNNDELSFDNKSSSNFDVIDLNKDLPMNAKLSGFKKTFNMFKEFTELSRTISYQEWAERPFDERVAIILVNFYDQIQLAWYKHRGEHTWEEEGVEEAMLMCSKLCGLSLKQPTLEKAVCKCTINESSYNPRYIYSIFVNAFKSLNYETTRVRSDYQHPKAIERGDIQVTGQYFIDVNGVEQDVFNHVSNDGDMEDELIRSEMWDLIESSDDVTKDVIDKLQDLDKRVSDAHTAANKEKDSQKKLIKLAEVDRVEQVRETYRTKHADTIQKLQKLFISYNQ